MVQNILQWIKDNLVTVLCTVVILISLGAFGWIHISGGRFQAAMAERNQEVTTIDSYQIRTVQIPPEDPDDPPKQIKMPVTENAIDRLRQVYNELDSAFKQVYQTAGERNRAGHQPMIAGLFPKELDPANRFNSRQAYIASMYALYAALDAGAPPDAKEIAEADAREDTTLRQSYLLGPTVQLTAKQAKELTQKRADRRLDLYKRAAGKAHMYAAPVSLQLTADDKGWQPGPFQVGDWVKSSRPQIEDIWEGQMRLWIQQDLVQSLRIANEVTNPDTTLIQQPVKRLLSMSVDPEYIGIGDLNKIIPDQIDPETLLKADQYETQVGSKLPNNFATSPTGRQSNVLYDVRHARLSVIADSRQLPKLINAIGRVNFMTIIGMQITNVKDFDALHAGDWYGTGVDAVRVDLTIETIWLRSWTAGHVTPEYAAAKKPPEVFNPGLMPDSIRIRLGLPPRVKQAPVAPGGATTPAPDGTTPATPATPEAAPATPEATPPAAG